MAREREIKIELRIPLETFLERIKESGFEREKEISQRDHYFDTFDWRLYKTAAAFRIRQVNGRDQSFAFKKMFCLPEKHDRLYIEEIEGGLPVADHDKLDSIFKRLGMDDKSFEISNGESLGKILSENGFQGEQVLAKTRQIFKNGRQDEIVVDDVENVGTIIELECRNDEPLDFAGTILEDDEWSRSVLGTSYIWLEKVKGFTDHLEYQARFDQNPVWNVWENEKEIYEHFR